MTAASPLSLTQTSLSAGRWEGVLTGSSDIIPISASLDGAVIAEAEVAPLAGQPGSFAVRLALPATVLSDGVQTVLLHSGETVLAKVTIMAGSPLDDDLRAEIGLLRAELDLLKRAFQRQSRG
ncbi:MAG: hypothetical protein B7Z10_06310 [Rhodobacterales bacterium 32-66-7]|nr:MAG: hypothetical protein B7Z31_13815 [Rhodobacterales bacterium 12-65-15]OYX25454.1 MAG: hypothetical protein B7Z10_06310 [Rhodobacterales bacterium 32-66-7]OZA12514.1 MAG: hypothetical protein B7Y02_07230 [Rhodobacterales bacterium 17-64-5]